MRVDSRLPGMRVQSGLSLVELMIALLLGTLLSIGLVQVFTSNSQSFRTNEASARAQESGRIAMDILARALRNSGFFGCFPVQGVTNNLDETDPEFDRELHGFEVLGVSAIDDASYSERPSGSIAGTDFLRVTAVRRPGETIRLAADVSDTTDIRLTDAGTLQAGDFLYLSNCERGDIFQISSLAAVGSEVKVTADNANGSSGVPGNDFSANAPAACSYPGPCLSAAYDEGTEVYQPYSEIYYIGESADGGRSLFLRQSDGSSVELVAGVEDMALRFGEGTTTTGVQNWREADSVTDWDDVLAVEVSLLVASPNDNVVDSPQSYCFPGWEDCVADSSKLTEAADRRLYRVYTFTSAVRNRF
ncbi:MAG: hypothetical protein CMI11_11155 [Oceanospirillales bacterium]|nr:hypothetical protein [Marinobacter sp.]MBI44018.1 hypothetical protein [Oceanospirillales bacterium]